ncbi:hypothetical protein [Clostridium butyricum]
MSEISKIVIKGESGYCCVDEAYTDKVTVTWQSISYEYNPIFETEINPSRKWSYKTNSPGFKKLYADLVEVIPVIVNHDIDIFYTDIGKIEFIITYSDKTKLKKIFYIPGDEFKDCFQIIKRMVPGCECIPRVLMTEDDYEDYED